MIYVVLWFIVGLFSAMSMWIYDMRGRPYNGSYFDEDCVLISIVIIFCGYFSPIILITLIMNANKFITKMIWKIANIGLKK